MRKPIQLSGIVSSMSLRKDKSLRVGFVTQELTEIERNEALKYYDTFGYILFKPEEFNDSDIPKGNPEKKGKSMSQRLRHVLYRYWEQTNTEQTAEQFYREKMENIIDMVKKKLNV